MCLNTPCAFQERFQSLGAVYKLLSDKDRRAVYDETGDIDEGEDMDPDKDWDQYWRLLFKVPTSEFRIYTRVTSPSLPHPLTDCHLVLIMVVLY